MRPATVVLGLAISAMFVGCSSNQATKPPLTKTEVIRRTTLLTVTCGVQLLAKGEGAAPNEVVKIRIQEQVPKGIDLSEEVVADNEGRFVMADYCDPKSPNAEVPALWTYAGATSGRKGSDLVLYQLDGRAATTTTAR